MKTKRTVKLKAIPFNQKRHELLGTYLRELRSYHLMSQGGMAKKLKMGQSNLSNIELGRGTLSPERFRNLAKVFSINPTLMGRLKVINLNQKPYGLVNARHSAIGQYVRDVRRANKVSMEKMAELMNVDYSDIAHIEWSEDTFTKRELEKFIKILKLPRIQAYRLRVNNDRLATHLKKFPKIKSPVYYRTKPKKGKKK